MTCRCSSNPMNPLMENPTATTSMKKRKVMFASPPQHVIISAAARCCCGAEEDDDASRNVSEFWYTETEISIFRADARETCRLFFQQRQQPQQQQKQQPQCRNVTNHQQGVTTTATQAEHDCNHKNDATVEAQKELCMDGLGFLLSNERKKNRVLAIRGTIKTQQCCCKQDPMLISTVAQELTAWAKEVAIFTAVMNYYEVHVPNTNNDHGRCCSGGEMQLKFLQKVSVPCPLSALRKRLHSATNTTTTTTTTTSANSKNHAKASNDDKQRCVRQCRRGPLEVHV